MHRVRAWFFDAVGTLIHPDPPAVAVYAEVGRRHGSRLPETVVAARFREAFRAEEIADRRTSDAAEVERWRRIVAHVLDDVCDSRSVFAELWDHFARPTAWRCEPEAAEVLATAERLGLILGVASNFDSRLRTVLDGLPELRPLRHVVVSSEVGWRKPAPAFFEALLDSCGCRADEVLLIGDDVENDHAGGNAAGLHTVLYDPADRHRDVVGLRVQRLGQLLSGFAGWEKPQSQH